MKISEGVDLAGMALSCNPSGGNLCEDMHHFWKITGLMWADLCETKRFQVHGRRVRHRCSTNVITPFCQLTILY